MKLYGDESADETKVRAFAVAAVVGSDDEWADAIRQWLRRTRGAPFHATDLETRNAKDPDPQKHKDDKKLYEDLTQILAKSYLVGVAVALDLAAYQDVIGESFGDWQYFKAMADVISAAASMAKKFNTDPNEKDSIRLEFTFDSRKESNGTAGTLYTMLVNQPEWAGLLNTRIGFESSRIEPRLEIGDMLARESMKELDRKVSCAPRPMRTSRKVLDETKKFVFIEHRRDYWEKLRDFVRTPESTAVMDEFEAWLRATGRVQGGKLAVTIQNWFIFNAYLDSHDLLKSLAKAVDESFGKDGSEVS